MNIKNLGWLAATLIFGLTGACGEQGDEGTAGAGEEALASADGALKTNQDRADAWNARNDPRGFREVLDYTFENLPLEGRTNITPWTASYWPYYQDGINFRWQPRQARTAQNNWRGLSPAEKYDIAFNTWTPEQGFTDLKPFNATTCEFDAQYYASLGPAADWTHKNKGLRPMTNGIDDDKDGVADADECAQNREPGNEKPDFDRIESWWGICHAWAPAALVEPEPLAAVTRNGVTFDVSDQKGLIIQQWDRTSAHSVGGRCNDTEIERDETTGRVLSTECRDLNPGSWHVLVSNFLGINQKGIVIERTTNYQIWNQPLFGYKIDEQKEISLQEALSLLNLDKEPEPGNGVFIHEVEEESSQARAILALVNTATLEQLDDDARLYSTAAKRIIAHRHGADGQPDTSDDNLFDTLKELDGVGYVGSRAFGQLLNFALAQGFGDDAVYTYNPEAERFIQVRMTTDWIAEQLQSDKRSDTIIDRYTHHDTYDYVLELDADGKIIGGEWIGDSNLNHPDFVWTPVRAISGNPHIDINTVRDMINEGRKSVLGDEEPAQNAFSFTSSEPVAIPDNSPKGATSTIAVDTVGTVKTIKLRVSIEHTYRGDLALELRHGGIAINVFNGSGIEEPWEDNLTLDGVDVHGFEGSNLSGDWQLFVVDTYGQDVGQLVSWGIDFGASE